MGTLVPFSHISTHISQDPEQTREGSSLSLGILASLQSGLPPPLGTPCYQR